MTQEIRPIITPDSLNRDTQYSQFVLDLQRCWNLTQVQPPDLTWASKLPRNDFYNKPTSTRVALKYLTDDPKYAGTPNLSVAVFCMYSREGFDDGSGCMEKSPEYTAPLLVESGGPKRLGSTQLPLYEIKWNEKGRLMGKPKTFENVLKDELKVTSDNVPVLDVVAFLPVPTTTRGRKFYETHFLPTLTSVNQYGVYAIAEDRLPRHTFMTPATVHCTDDSGNFVSFKASYVPDMSSMEKALLPTHHGHMLIVTKGLKIKEEPPIPFRFEPSFQLPDSGDGFGLRYGGGSKSLSFGLPAPTSREYVPKTEIGDTSIDSGRETGHIFKKVEAVEDPTQQPVIFHLKTIGVRRVGAGGLSEALINQLFDTINHYPILN